jgi:carboxyl-terminal processing protease
LREKIDEPLVFSITRATITLPTVETSVRESEGVFIISLYNFSSHSVELFHNALEEYIASGKTNLILDLRGNPGGYLEAAVDISSMFLPQGKVVVKEVGKTPDDVNVHLTRGRKLFPQGHKLVILVDKGSASASEIVAGALSEHQAGTLVGVQTFGKGSVQEVINLTSDTSMKVTVAKWYTPEGISISESGLSPKIEIKQGDTKGVDTQLDAAVALFKKL